MFRYAINTNRFKELSLPEIVELCRRAGADGIEWGLPKPPETKAAAVEMRKAAEDAGLEVAAFINGGHLWKRDVMETWSEAVAAAGGGMLRVSPPWYAWNLDESLRQRDSFRDLMRRTRDGLIMLTEMSPAYGIRYVVELHAGGVVASPAVACMLMEGLDPKAVGVIYDAANTFLEGFLRPRQAVELLGDHLAYLHVKNVALRPSGWMMEGGVARAAWEHASADLPMGAVDWYEVLFALKLHGFSGWLSLEEFFCDRPDETDAIRRGIAFLKECAQAAPERLQEPYTTFND